MKECPACKRCYRDEVIHCPADGVETAPTLLGEPTLDNRYLLERRLGQGGMGVVFQARHIFLKTSHAIKVILPDLVGNDPMLATRFRQEALAAAAIRHQNIIAVTDFGVVRSTMPFLVMEFVKGRSLQELLTAEGPMPPARAWELISAAAAGVGAAHRQNIVHRDLKPLNIMIQDGLPVAEGLKILDFGLAKIKSGELLGSFVQAQTTGLMGSPFYMAPEQWSDEEPDSRADIYSLGVIMYQMLAGEVPFKGTSIPSIMKKHLTLPPPSFHSMGASVPPAIEAVVRHALEKDVAARTDSVETFLKELRAAMNATPVAEITTRDTLSLDPSKTIASNFSSTGAPVQVADKTQVASEFESMAGTVSATSLDSDDAKEITDSATQLKHEREAWQREAREHQTREAEAARIAAEREDLRRREEEARLKKEREEREAREKEQHDKLERMSLQAKELEARLNRLSTSIAPPHTLLDPETTHLRESGVATQTGQIYQGTQPIQRSQGITIDMPAKQGKSKLLMILGGVFILLIAASVITLIWLNARPTVSTNQKATNQTLPKIPTKAEQVSITGGTFRMGADNGPLPSTPSHPVTVKSFFMDKTEVTNSDYAEFVKDTNHAAPAHWGGTRPPFGQELWPVVNVSLDDASAFAVWRSKRDGLSYRLPTEEEWEFAARNGAKADLYPWGSSWQDKIAVVKEATPSPVDSRPMGRNIWGVSDLIGNVWEWTSSKVSVYPGNPTVVPANTADWIAIRGGCYVSDPTKATATLREFVPSSTRTTLLGFRLVRGS